jgi:hypothetical protein
MSRTMIPIYVSLLLFFWSPFPAACQEAAWIYPPRSGTYGFKKDFQMQMDSIQTLSEAGFPIAAVTLIQGMKDVANSSQLTVLLR